MVLKANFYSKTLKHFHNPTPTVQILFPLLNRQQNNKQDNYLDRIFYSKYELVRHFNRLFVLIVGCTVEWEWY